MTDVEAAMGDLMSVSLRRLLLDRCGSLDIDNQISPLAPALLAPLSFPPHTLGCIAFLPWVWRAHSF